MFPPWRATVYCTNHHAHWKSIPQVSDQLKRLFTNSMTSRFLHGVPPIWEARLSPNCHEHETGRCLPNFLLWEARLSSNCHKHYRSRCISEFLLQGVFLPTNSTNFKKLPLLLLQERHLPSQQTSKRVYSKAPSTVCVENYKIHAPPPKKSK